MRLELATYDALRYACLHFHYAKAVPAAVCSFSVFNDNDEWCGCIVYSGGANSKLGNKFNLVQGEWCELVRVALNGKQEATSQALAMSIKMLKQYNPLLKLIISYADCDQSHTGIIYQATNWIYEGKVQLNGGTPRIRIFGAVKHPRTIGKKGWKCNIEWLREHIDPNAEYVYTLGKHKYIMPLTKKMRKICAPLAQPYPKREEQQSDNGGLTQ